MDGVLWKENTPIVDLKNAFTTLDQNAIRYVFATNNSTKSPSEYVEKINNFGGNVQISQIFTSATTLAKSLLARFPSGGPVFLIGEKGLRDIFYDHGFFHQDANVLAVVGGLDREVTYQELAKATLLLNAGVDFFFTNIDPSYPSTNGDIPGAGAILSFLETASGKKAYTVGKPKEFMFENALTQLNSIPENTIVVGDRLETDILGGKNANCLTALLLSGVSTLQNIEDTQIRPDLICTDLDEFLSYMIRNDWQIYE